MFLTRLILDLHCRQAKIDKSSPEDLHKTVMRLFPTTSAPTPRKALGVLHRLEEGVSGQAMLIIQSALQPNFETLHPGYLLDLSRDLDLAELGILENPSVREVGVERLAIATSDRFRFRLRANTTKRLAAGGQTERRKGAGKRVPVRGDDGRMDWLKRHAERCGFKPIEVVAREVSAQGSRVRLAGALFEGILEVVEADAFREALNTGIGPAKAFGFGLLSVRRI